LGRGLLVLDRDDLELLVAGGGVHGGRVPDAAAGQRRRDRRAPADAAAARVGLIDADDAPAALAAGVVPRRDGRAEPGDLARLRRRVDDLGGLQAPQERGEPLLVLELLPAVAVRGLALGVDAPLQIGEPRGREVVLDAGRPFVDGRDVVDAV